MLRIPEDETILYRYKVPREDWLKAWKKVTGNKRTAMISVAILPVMGFFLSLLSGATDLSPTWSIIVSVTAAALAAIPLGVFTTPLVPSEWALGSNAIYFVTGGQHSLTRRIPWSKMDYRGITVRRSSHGLVLKPEKWYHQMICLLTRDAEEAEAIILTLTGYPLETDAL